MTLADDIDELIGLVKRHRTLFKIVLAVIVLELALVAYSGMWPPLYAVKSASMQHSDNESMLGVIDTGDMVIVRNSDGGGVRTYVECYHDGGKAFGDYGDVIIYDPYGYDYPVPVVHRAMVRLERNKTTELYDVPSLARLPADKWGNGDYEDGRWWNLKGFIEIYDVGRHSATLRVNLTSLLAYYKNVGRIHDGIITMGDNNVVYENGEWVGMHDQTSLGLCRSPIKDEWIIGEAIVEVPWLGLIKLYLQGGVPSYTPENSVRNLIASFVLLITGSLVLDGLINALRRRDIHPWTWFRSRLARKKD
ncbi:MAG: S26 family signal peptidase [Methanomassiliicoccales archaeon]|nr:S26 family signal peptidase [Methanomassiliicoccales archaeon]